jgi:uncharacterized membrane protein (Fun14 family)
MFIKSCDIIYNVVASQRDGDNMSELINPIITQVGIGGIGGFFVGYLIKRVLKFALIMGVFAFILIYFVYDKAIDFNYTELMARAEEIAVPAWTFVSPLLTQIPAIGSLVLGVLIGFTKT